MSDSELLTDPDYPETLRGFLTHEIRQAADSHLAFAATFNDSPRAVSGAWHVDQLGQHPRQMDSSERSSTN